MITTILIDLYGKELDKLKNEINAYESDELIWKSVEGAQVTGGNLCLYIAGNLQHNIGAMIGDSGYIRNKEAELKAKNVSRERLMEEIENTRQVVVDTLEQVSKSELLKVFPTKDFEEPVTTEFYLVHLLNNFGFNLGQIHMHRKVVS
jgi:ribosomal protein S8